MDSNAPKAIRNIKSATAELLSTRERDIISLIARGESNKEVARNLGISPETVKSHMKHIFTKLDVDKRAYAVARAQSLGFINGDARAAQPVPLIEMFGDSDGNIGHAINDGSGARNHDLVELDVGSEQAVPGAGELTCQAEFFVIVNDRSPREAKHCALCGSTLEKGYVRDQQTRLLFCDTSCFAGHAFFRKSHARKASRNVQILTAIAALAWSPIGVGGSEGGSTAQRNAVTPYPPNNLNSAPQSNNWPLTGG
jgi:DNA-binding CsgD family transcriptional regulator